MKICVTGCNGSVGRRVVRLALLRGYDVLGIDQRDIPVDIPEDATGTFTYVNVDLMDHDATVKALAGCEAVVHLAAIPRPVDYSPVIVHNR